MRHWFCFLTFAALLLAASPAEAVIRVDVRVSAIYDVAKLVLIGTVAGVDPAAKVVEFEVAEVPKGTFEKRRVRLRFTDDVAGIKVGEPVVLFNGVRGASVHLADYFWHAEAVAGSQPLEWEITRRVDIQPRFPGRTAAIAKVVRELAAGHSTLMNAMEHTVWRGGIKCWGRVMPSAAYVIATDLNGDGKAEVLIGNDKATQLLVNNSDGFDDKTKSWGLAKARGKWAAFADVNGDHLPDVLIGNRIWINQGGHFSQGPEIALPETDPLAVALIDVTGDGRPDVVCLSKTGELQAFENPGADGATWKALPVKMLFPSGEMPVTASFSNDWGDTGKPHVMVVRSSGVTRYALDADGGPPAEFQRLCGETLDSFNRLKNQTHWNIAGSVALDLNGDGREDFIVFHDDGGPTFVNRGFGTFLLSTEPAVGIRTYKSNPVPWKVTPNTRFGAGDIHGDKFEDLLIVTPEGELFELNNIPYPQIAD